MEKYYRANITKMEFLESSTFALDPFLTILSDGPRASYAFAERTVRLLGMDFCDIFDNSERLLFKKTPTDAGPPAKMWIINAIWSICGVVQADEDEDDS